MPVTAQRIYRETVRRLPAAERLRLAVLILNELTGHGASSPPTESHQLAADPEIGQLCDEIARMTTESDPDRKDPALDQRLRASWSRLRELQTKEARRYREAFEASLAMPLDVGAKILAEARALRRELEDLTSTDHTTESADRQAP